MPPPKRMSTIRTINRMVSMEPAFPGPRIRNLETDEPPMHAEIDG
jgi:hypothetical protein